MRPIDADAYVEKVRHEAKAMPQKQGETFVTLSEWIMEKTPSVEPNRILPEQMERGDIYEVGETIIVMNHDDYYDLLCKSWAPKHGEWVFDEKGYFRCSECGRKPDDQTSTTDFCPWCGASMRERDGE